MRLFIAITLKDKIKDVLNDRIHQMKKNVKRGSFTLRENLHVTLVFIGETNRLDEVKQAMKNAIYKTSLEKFSITFRGIGSFKRREGDIYWIGIDPSEKLNIIHRELSKELDTKGFFMETREYQPHVTLGRKVLIDSKFDINSFHNKLIPIDMEVSKISLMKSERIQGILTYEEIYWVEL